VFAPGEASGHGKASDLIDIDESWAFTLEQGRAITQAVAATQLTTGGQLAFVSTMGTVGRSMWFHSKVDEARTAFDAGAREGIALVDIGLPEDRADELRSWLEDGTDSPRWWAALEVLAAHHPAYGYTIESVSDLATVARTEGTLNGVDGILRALGNVPTKLHAPALSFSAWLRRQAPSWPSRPGRVVLGVEVGLERSDATIAAAWVNGPDVFVDVIDHRPGADWVPARLDTLATEWGRPPIYGVHGPATETLAEARRRGHTTTILPGRAYATACQGVIDAVTDNARLWHRGAPALNDAVKVAAAVTSGGVRVWTRAGSAGTISAIIAATAARYGALEAPPPGPKPLADAG